ncbi:MAG TPA: type II secretion system F family protein [Patescibacteria group bacterium]|nr:type II secretion system F family protein [Patescibacteria group bacterium]
MPTITKETAPFMTKLNAWVSDNLTHVSFVQKILFVHNLHIMVKAGLSIVDALRILSEQVDNKKLKTTIGAIKSQVEKGQQLSEVLAQYPKIFPPIYVSMIAAGEVAGKLEESLEQVLIQMKKTHELTSRIRGALIYPAVVMSAMVGIGIEMVVFVLPKILVLFKDFEGAQLPLATRILITIVEFMGRYGVFVGIGVFVFIALIVWLERKLAIKRVVHRLNLRLPIAGPIIKKINLARFTLTLSSLLQSTIPIIEAVRITATVQTNLTYREDLLMVSETLKKGEALSETLGRFPKQFTPMVVQMIMVGEQSGQVEQMLKELAEYYGNEVDATMKNFSTIIEPVIILLLGVAVAGMAVAVIMPMYSLAQNF